MPAPPHRPAPAPPLPPLTPPPQGFLGVKDILCALFEWNCVVLYKPHPQLAGFHAIIERALAPLQEAGYYCSAACDLATTQHMMYHPLVMRAGWAGGRGAVCVFVCLCCCGWKGARGADALRESARSAALPLRTPPPPPRRLLPRSAQQRAGRRAPLPRRRPGTCT
jgi:hypothetical protein